MAPQLVVLGWDSATFDVVDPLIGQGRLPHLARIMEGGFRAPLRSTWPPMTDCAWTSAFTGVNPGAHGIFGSWYRAPGQYGCRYFSSRDRRAPAVWEIAEGTRFLVWNVPMTYPPEDVSGAIVAGYGAPPGSDFCRPRELQSELARRWPLEDLLDRAPHGSIEGFLDDLERGLRAQAEALPWAAQETGADCVLAVWPHVDRAQHFFWQFRGTDHPLAGAVDRVYDAMDAATGAVIDAFPDADVVVVSDHGAGPLKGDVNVGAWLVQHGYAYYSSSGGSMLSKVAWALPAPVRRLGRRMAPGVARDMMAARLAEEIAPFEWSQTKAFFGVHGDLWLNLEGREPNGIVTEDDAPAVLDEIAGELESLVDPSDGAPVFAAVHRGPDVYKGDAVFLAPDAIVDSWSAGYRVAPNRADSTELVVRPSPLAGVGESWSSDHRPLGILAASGPRIAAGSAHELALYDVAPLVLALLGQSVPEGLDGRAPSELLTPEFLEKSPVQTSGPRAERDAGGEFSEEEAAAVAAHLKDLGYIE